jgi:diguanylate cyclase (GGDEF)-like protein
LVRQGIEDLEAIYRNTPLKRVTTTLGVVIYPEHGESSSQLIEFADKVLYLGKKDGRNRIHFAS